MDIKRNSPALLGDTRGAVMAEGIIVLPVFVITLAAVLYFHGLYAAKLDASNKVRSCAWHYANAGCDETKVPKGCQQRKVTDGFEALGGTVEHNPFQGDGVSPSATTADEKSSLKKGIAGANRVGQALLGLESGVEMSSGKDVDRPSILGGGKRTVFSNYTVMCNEVDRTPTDLMYDAYCALGTELNFPGC